MDFHWSVFEVELTSSNIKVLLLTQAASTGSVSDGTCRWVFSIHWAQCNKYRLSISDCPSVWFKFNLIGHWQRSGESVSEVSAAIGELVLEIHVCFSFLSGFYFNCVFLLKHQTNCWLSVLRMLSFNIKILGVKMRKINCKKVCHNNKFSWIIKYPKSYWDKW